MQAFSEQASSSEGFTGLVNNLLFGVRFASCKSDRALPSMLHNIHLGGVMDSCDRMKGSMTREAHEASWTPYEQSLIALQAASSLERGDATCAKCRGAGALSCSSCKVISSPSRLHASPLHECALTLQMAHYRDPLQGAGVKNQKVRMNQIRHAFNRYCPSAPDMCERCPSYPCCLVPLAKWRQ